MWFKDEELVISDPGACLLVVEEPGIYQCVVKFGNVTEVSNPISIISVTEATGFSSPEPEAQRPNRDHPEQDQAAQAPASVDQIESPCVSVPEVLVDELNIDTAHTLGAFGTVRRGHWAGSDIAVKTIKISKRGKGQMLRMIVSEVGISARLRQLNIVQFLPITKEPSAVHLVKEFIDG